MGESYLFDGDGVLVDMDEEPSADILLVGAPTYTEESITALCTYLGVVVPCVVSVDFDVEVFAVVGVGPHP